MTYFRRIVVVQNDYGRDLQMQITDDQDNAFDLSGCSCTISVREKSNFFNIISSQICTITSEDEGTLKYTIPSIILTPFFEDNIRSRCVWISKFSITPT